jgi:hypothetical protein
MSDTLADIAREFSAELDQLFRQKHTRRDIESCVSAAIRAYTATLLDAPQKKGYWDDLAIQPIPPDAPLPATQRSVTAEKALDHLADVHREWCTYCNGDAIVCLNAPAGGCSLRDYMIAVDRALK